MSSLQFRTRTLMGVVMAVVLVPPPANAQALPGRGLVDVLRADTPGAASLLDSESAGDLPTRAPDVTMRGSGWGHSVGMSQYGALAQARAGRSVAQILSHYYPGVAVGTQGSAPASSEIRVELFNGRVNGDAARHVELAVRGRDGTAGPTTAATVRMAPERAVRALPPPSQAWTLAHDGDAFVLRSADGGELERGPGPVHLDIAPPGGANPGILCLPQRGCSASSLAGTLQWGFVRVTWDAGAQRMRPVLHVPLELYLRGLAEVPSDWDMAALQAQAVAGRTYATRRLNGNPWHLDTTPGTQAYGGWAKEGGASGGRWVQAVDATSRQVISYGGRLAETPYSSSHGGRSENVQDSWAFSATTDTFPYLRSVDDAWSLQAGNPYASWTATVSNDELVEVVRAETGLARVASVGVASRTAGGTPRSLTVHGWTAEGQRATRTFTGTRNAGATLRKAWPSRDGQPFVRSQQLRSFSVSPFTDDDGSMHEFNILVAAAEQITRGCAAGRYCPSRPLTRGQMATFLARALDLRVDPNEADRFSDIAGSPHRAAINAVAREGITAGCADGARFCPGLGVTRDQMASFLARGFELPAGPPRRYTDVEAGSPHAGAIDRVAARGITTGCARDRYCPRTVVNRAQMASFVARALGEGW